MITYTDVNGAVHVLCTQDGSLVERHQPVEALGNDMHITSVTPPSYAREGVYVYGTSANDPEPRHYLVKVESINMKWVPL